MEFHEMSLSQYDRNMIEWLAAGLHPSGPKEHVEEGISSIELSASSSWNREYRPIKGRVKWFRDPFGQLWVKFRILKGSDAYDHVAPASRVVHVQYPKGAE